MQRYRALIFFMISIGAYPINAMDTDKMNVFCLILPNFYLYCTPLDAYIQSMHIIKKEQRERNAIAKKIKALNNQERDEHLYRTQNSLKIQNTHHRTIFLNEKNAIIDTLRFVLSLRLVNKLFKKNMPNTIYTVHAFIKDIIVCTHEEMLTDFDVLHKAYNAINTPHSPVSVGFGEMVTPSNAEEIERLKTTHSFALIILKWMMHALFKPAFMTEALIFKEEEYAAFCHTVHHYVTTIKNGRLFFDLLNLSSEDHSCLEDIITLIDHKNTLQKIDAHRTYWNQHDKTSLKEWAVPCVSAGGTMIGLYCAFGSKDTSFFKIFASLQVPVLTSIATLLVPKFMQDYYDAQHVHLQNKMSEKTVKTILLNDIQEMIHTRFLIDA